MEEIGTLILIGLLGGGISSLFGVGGGVVFVPLFNSVIKLDLKKAIGTSIACIVPISLISFLSHYRKLSVDLPVLEIILLVASSVLAAQLGVKVVSKISTKSLLKVYISYLVFTSVKILFFPREALVGGEVADLPGWFPILIIGLSTGFLSSLLGIGGGIVIVSSLAGIYGVDMILAITMSLLVIVPTTISGMIGHWKKGNVEVRYILPIVIPAGFSAFIFAELVHYLGSNHLGKYFSIFSIFMAFVLWKKHFYKKQ
ncbi:MAG: sulfite exporter TauE/SafE family protein [Leptospiraceae bacterium]|nr:sulfite exporter TauE/SafE family protein [Leptospiraceae bacterium]MCP5512528.1 sulfite exporter TauE/SafE family protein [Leptospiraceae bacterium]